MSDDSAVSLPAPAGLDGMVEEPLDIIGLDGKPLQVDVAYFADGRTVALAKIPGPDKSMPSAYGVTKNGILRRGAKRDYVASQWLTDPTMRRETLLSNALREFLPMLDNSTLSLTIDDRAVLGLLGEAPQTKFDATHWDVAVGGELRVPGLLDVLSLRPTRVAQDGRTLRFFEPGVAVPTDQLNQLSVTFAFDLEGNVRTLPGKRPLAIEFDLPVALLLDEQTNGAWERVTPLWLPTDTGYLRVEQARAAMLPYRLAGESRVLDIQRWFPELGAGTRARLLLDASGPKQLDVTLDANGPILRFAVTVPALVFVVAGSAVDGSTLAAPDLPPGTDRQDKAAALQLVPLHLCGMSTSSWSMRYYGALELDWHAGQEGEALTHFTAYEKWLAPLEAATNDAPGISSLRSLLPMLPDKDVQRFRVARGELTAHGSSALFVPLDPFSTLAAEAFRYGPLASFGAEKEAEWWPHQLDKNVTEPAPLRSLYRLLPAGLASQGVLASYASTRVKPGKPALYGDQAATSLATLPASENRLGISGWCYRDASNAVSARIEPTTDWPGAYFGWHDAYAFLAPAALTAEGSAPTNPALAWGQITHQTGDYEAVRWIRLGDDSLRSLAGSKVETRAEAVAALVDPAIAFDDPVLAPNDVEVGGLTYLRLSEQIKEGKNELTLRIGELELKLDEPERQRGNRVVFAFAGRQKCKVAIGPAVQAITLNRLYLELERRGGHFVVARGMLGWSADRVFGMAASGDFQVTERFERQRGVLARSLDFNGVLTRQLNGKHRVTVYFWDAVLTQASPYLRVICDYQIQDGADHSTSICALQDAMVNDDTLDLSADIAILGTRDGKGTAVRANPWQPNRRDLFRLIFDNTPDDYDYAGFLQIRAAGTNKVVPQGVNETLQPRIVPAWFLCDSDIVPWFDGESGPKPKRTNWTAAGVLRTGTVINAANKGLRLTLYATAGMQRGQCYGSTLIGVGGAQTGLPLWVPSPVRVPREDDGKNNGAAGPAMCRLWLFDPAARLVAQWPWNPEAENPNSHEQARNGARQRLWRMGWTREAVLELATGKDDELTWQVIDSPLLNRGASLDWFGWPLAAEAQHPHDMLPMSRQVAQASRGDQPGFSLQVEFEGDRFAEAPRALLVRDAGYSFTTPDGQAVIGTAEGVQFRAAGLRVGVYHKLVAYGAGKPQVALAPKLLAPVGQTPGATASPLSIEKEWVVWQQDLVDLSAVGLTAFPDNVLRYVWALACKAVRIDGAPLGMQWLSPQGWQDVRDGADLALGTTEPERTSLQLRAPPGSAWSTLQVTLVRDEGSERRTLFPPSGARVAAVLAENDATLAFGEEHTFYRPPTDTTDAGSATWSRALGVRLPARLAGRVLRVRTIDLDGLIVEHVLG